MSRPETPFPNLGLPSIVRVTVLVVIAVAVLLATMANLRLW